MGLRRSFKPTNLIKNGNFAVDALWTKLRATTTGGVGQLTASGLLAYLIQANMFAAGTKTGNKIYLSYAITENSLASANLKTGGVSGPDFTAEINLISNLGKNSALLTVIAGAVNQLSLWIPASIATGTITIDNVMAIDLTVSSLPPAIIALSDANLKTWCDLNIPAWFDGTMSGGRIGGTRR